MKQTLTLAIVIGFLVASTGLLRGPLRSQAAVTVERPPLPAEDQDAHPHRLLHVFSGSLAHARVPLRARRLLLRGPHQGPRGCADIVREPVQQRPARRGPQQGLLCDEGVRQRQGPDKHGRRLSGLLLLREWLLRPEDVRLPAADWISGVVSSLQWMSYCCAGLEGKIYPVPQP